MKIDPGLIDMLLRLRGRGISSNPVLSAIEATPRRYFVPEAQRDQAYDPVSIPLACGQTLPPPLSLAMMAQMLDVQPDQKLLLCGLGSGYLAGILSHLAVRVYAVERYQSLIRMADAVFRNHDIVNVVTRHGDGRYGWPGQAPFDRIILAYAVRAAPETLLDQLAPNGKLLAVVDEMLTLYTKARTRVESREIMPLQLDMVEAGKSKTL